MIRATVEIKANNEEHFQILVDDLYQKIKKGTRAMKCWYIWDDCHVKYDKKEE